MYFIGSSCAKTVDIVDSEFVFAPVRNSQNGRLVMFRRAAAPFTLKGRFAGFREIHVFNGEV